jgi:pimeloyl-ACP methyl ester carboxylesterase
MDPPDMSVAAELTSRPDFVRVRGLRYHVRRWGDPQRPILLLGHGWLDVSATFQQLVQPLLDLCQVLAPDWRGFGHTQWPQDGYWFQDYVADLDALVQHYSPQRPVWLAGHSMGAQIMSLYAGLRPQRVSRLVCLDGLFLPDMPAELAPKRFSRWLDQQQGKARSKTYPSFEFLAERIRIQHPRLSPEQALFIARCWGAEDGRGRIRLLADPRHRLDMPTLYKSAESMAIWRQITAPTLFLDAAASNFAAAISADERGVRRNCFQHREEAVVADSGHMLHFDAPEATGQAIRRFLAKTQ